MASSKKLAVKSTKKCVLYNYSRFKIINLLSFNTLRLPHTNSNTYEARFLYSETGMPARAEVLHFKSLHEQSGQSQNIITGPRISVYLLHTGHLYNNIDFLQFLFNPPKYFL